MNLLRLGQLEDMGSAWYTLSYEHAGHTWQIEVPHHSPDQLALLAQRVRASGAALKAMPVSQIMAAVDQTMATLLDPQNPQRQLLELWLPRITGLDAEMVRLGLNACFKTFRTPQLQRFVAQDFGNPKCLDEFQPSPKGGMLRAVGPELLVHVWAGNVPGLPLWSLISGLLVKAPSVGKVSSAEPLVAHVVAQVLTEVEPRLAPHVAVVWFQGGDAERERVLCEAADVVLAYGGNTSLAALRAQVPVTTRFLPHGHKLSATLVSAAALDVHTASHTAHQAALDVVRFEQQGCYSPQVVYVARGGRISPKEFSELMAQELAALQHKYPRRGLSLEESAGVSTWRQTQEFASEPSAYVLGDAAAPWAVAYVDSASQLAPSALNRTLKVMAVDHVRDAVPHLAAQRRFVQTLGLAVSPEELQLLAEPLALAGVTRLCALGSMTSPEPGWHHDGRFSLLDLVRMVDLEASAESAAESYASYRD